MLNGLKGSKNEVRDNKATKNRSKNRSLIDRNTEEVVFRVVTRSVIELRVV